MEETIVVTPIEGEIDNSNEMQLTAEQNEAAIDQRMNFAFSDDNEPVGQVEEISESATQIEEIAPIIINPFKDLGFETADDLKAELEILRNKKAEPVYENEQSKKVHQLLAEGKIKEVIKVYEIQEQLDTNASVEITKDTAEGVLKLAMQLKAPKLTPEQINFQYKQDYLPPKEPVQKSLEDDTEFEDRMNEWKEKCESLEMKRIIAATMAQPDLEAAKQKIQLPNISVPQSTTESKEYENFLASSAEEEKYLNEVVIPSIKSLKEDDLKMFFEVNDPKNQMQFKVSITPSKEHLESAKEKAIKWDDYLRNTVYDKDGNFLPTKAAQIILKNDYFDEYAQSMARQSVNAERINKVKETRNGNNVNRDFSINNQRSDLDAMMEYRMS